MDFDTVYKLIKNKMKYAEEYGEIIKTEGKKFNINVMDRGLILDAIDAVYSYANFNEKEIYAGFPYFNEFWLRDALLVLPSFLSMNNFSFVRDILVKIAYSIEDRGLPNKIDGDIYPKDVLGLFLIDAYEYFRYTADNSFLAVIKDKKDAVLEICRRWMDNGFVHDKGRETWMDSLDREFSIEIQAIWSKALEAVYKMYGDKDAKEMAYELRKSVNGMFNGSYLTDQKGKDINSANQIFALYFDAVDADKKPAVIKNIAENMLTEYGILSVSKNDRTFDFKGYQNGSIWPMLTLLFTAAAFDNGEKELGEQLLGILQKKNDSAQCSSRINEIFQPDGAPKGCPSQAWSIGLLPFISERYIAGIEPDLPNNEIIIRKRNGITTKKNLYLNNKAIEIDIADGDVKSNYGLTESSDRFILEL